MDLLVLSKRWVSQVFDGQDQLVLAEVRPVENGILLGLKAFRIGLCQRLMPPDEIADRIDDVIPNVLDKCIHEWRTHILDPTLNPHIVVEEVPLAGQNTEVDRKAIVFTIHDGEEAVFDLLRDVQDSGKIHQPLVVLAELAYSSDEEALVGLEELLEHDR